MQPNLVQHTLAIFEKIFRDLPPLVPENIRQDMAVALEQIKLNQSLTIEELEDTMIVFGKQIWPFRQAFQEFIEIYTGRLGEKFLRQKLSRETLKKYEEYLVYGGDFRDLRSGGQLDFFSSQEKLEICAVMVEVHEAVRQHARQAVVGTDSLKYEERVVEFSQVLDDIEKRLDALRQTADDEQEHPELASEIREQVRGFEYGLCSLGPDIQHDAVCEASDFFAERKKEKVHQRHVRLN